MFDDSIVDYMLRMQGRNISVKMDKKVADIGKESKLKTKEISRALKQRLVRFTEEWQPRNGLNLRRDGLMRIDLMTFVNADDQSTANYIMLSDYVVGENGPTTDIWNGLLGNAPFEDWVTPAVNRAQVGRWVYAFDETRVGLRERINEWTGHRTLRIYKLNRQDEAWNIVSRGTQGMNAFLDRIMHEDTDYNMGALRSFSVERTVAIDYELLGRHMIKAEEYSFEFAEVGIGFDALSYAAHPSTLWEEYADAYDTTPPFPRLIFVEYLYKWGQNTGWVTHPLSQYVAKTAANIETFDGEWYTYQIPHVNILSEDENILKDFQDFLRKRLVG